jgi:hypothetical protein
MGGTRAVSLTAAVASSGRCALQHALKPVKRCLAIFLLVQTILTADGQAPASDNRALRVGDTIDRALVSAAKAGTVAGVQKTLKEGANPNYIEPLPGYGDGFSPLSAAIFFSQSTDCVRTLLAAGADPLRVYDKKPWMFPLAVACQDSTTNRQVLRLLLANIKQLPPDASGIMEWVLYPVIRRGDTETLNRLKGLGARCGIVSGGGKAAFIAAAESGRYEEAEKWLRDYSQEYSQQTNRVDVNWAVDHLGTDHYFDDENLANLLRHAQQLGIIFFDSRNNPTWSRAVVYRCPKTAEVLGCPPEDLKKIPIRSTEELMLAASCNGDSLPLFTNLVQKCLADAPDRKAKASQYLFQILAQRVPLFSMQPNALKHLYSLGADVNYESTNNPEGLATPLQAAIPRHSLDVVQWLVREGADVNHINTGTKLTALELAAIWGQEDTVRWLLSHGARVQEQKTGRSLLAAALKSRNSKAVFPLLLAAGADPYTQHEEHKAAIDILADRLAIVSLRQLDKKGVYRSLIQEYTPPANSPFIGTWAYRPEGGGFGSMGITLQKDGTAVLGNDLGVGAAVWKATKDEVTILDSGSKSNAPQLRFKLVGNELLAGTNDTVFKLKKYDPSLPESDDDRAYPSEIQLQSACLTPDKQLFLQISGRHIQVPLSRLADAKTDRYGLGISDDNVLKWDDFQPGEIPQRTIAGSASIPLAPIKAHQQLSVRWDAVLTERHTSATPLSGHDYTLYPSIVVSDRYHGKGTSQYGAEVTGYVLVSNKPISSGRNWINIYFLRSRTPPKASKDQLRSP